MRDQRGDIVGVGVHIVAVVGLGGAAVAAAIVGDHAIALPRKNIICVSQSSAESGQPW